MNERIRELAVQAGFFPTKLTQVGPRFESLYSDHNIPNKELSYDR